MRGLVVNRSRESRITAQPNEIESDRQYSGQAIKLSTRRFLMNAKQNEIMRTGKGFIAALDQSGGSTPKAL